MCETMPELNFDFVMNCDQLEFPDIDLGMGFQEMIPDLSQEASPDIEFAADFLYSPQSQANFTPIPLLGSEKAFYYTQHEQQNYQFNLDYHGLPSTTTSSVQLDSLYLNQIPSGYKPQPFYDTQFVNCRKRKASSQQCDATNDFDTTSLGVNPKNESKPKRKRVQNARQRTAANVREKKRVVQLNDAFDTLKSKVPAFADDKRLSRMETLKHAMSYISFITQLLAGGKTDEVYTREDGVESFNLADIEQLKCPLLPSYVSDGTECSYISFMTQLLDETKTDGVYPRVESFSLADLEQLKYPLSPSYVSEETESSVSSSSC